MTREHAAVQLLKHGPLDLLEFQQITGWDYGTCQKALARVRAKGKVKLMQHGCATRRSIYAAI